MNTTTSSSSHPLPRNSTASSSSFSHPLPDEQTLSSCQLLIEQDKNGDHIADDRKCPSRWTRIRMRGWAILDDPKSSTLAKVYLVIASVFVVLSIFLLAASTDSRFNRSLEPDEWEEIMTDYEMEQYWDLIYPDKKHPNDHHDDDPTLPTSPSPSDWDTKAMEGTTTQNAVPTAGSQNTNSPPTSKRRKRSAHGEESPILEFQSSKDDFDTKADVLNTDKDEDNEDIRKRGAWGNKKDVSDLQSNVFVDATWSNKADGDYSNPLSELLLSFKQGIAGILRSSIKHKSPKHITIMTGKIMKKAAAFHHKKLGLKNSQNSGKEPLWDSEYTRKNSRDKRNQGEWKKPNKDLMEGIDRRHPDYTFHGRHRRSVTETPDDAGGEGGYGVPSNDSDSNPNVTTDVHNLHCIMMSGKTLKAMVESIMATTAIVLEEESVTSLPQAHTKVDWIAFMEFVCMIYFTIEFLLRFIFAPRKVAYLFSIYTIMDAIALSVMYIQAILFVIDPELKYTNNFMDAVNCFQIARVFRFFRLVKDVIGFRVLLLSIRTSWRELLLLLMYIVMAVTIFSTVVYFCERDNMESIPAAAWWAIVTMTTVGYGDMTPTTLLGRLIGIACALSGVLLIAVTVPIFVNNFILFYEHSKIALDSEFYAETTDERNNENLNTKAAATDNLSKQEKTQLGSLTSLDTAKRDDSVMKAATGRIDSGSSQGKDTSLLAPSFSIEDTKDQVFEVQQTTSAMTSLKHVTQNGGGKSFSCQTNNPYSKPSGLDRQSKVSASEVNPSFHDIEVEEIDLASNDTKFGGKK